MNNKFDDIYQSFNNISKKKYYNRFNKDDFHLKESDFYPPSDDRVLKSYIKDINGGDNFADFCQEFFELLDENDYYE